MKYKLAFLFGLLLLTPSCREEVVVLQPNQIQVTAGRSLSAVKGFYLLNEGNMGSNKATLDYFSEKSGIYTQNIFAATNPNVVNELGDVGNDLQIYGHKLYAVINCSNLVEVMDAETATHLKTIEIPNCRYIAFQGGKAYVSSYAGPVQVNPQHEQLGFVAEIDTATLEESRRINVGFQPEEIAFSHGKMYVANSGGYYPPRYDNTLSVIDLEKWEEIRRIEVAVNIHRVRPLDEDRLLVSCRGDYYDRPSELYVIDTRNDSLAQTISVPTTDFCISEDAVYLYSTDMAGSGNNSFKMLDINTFEIIKEDWLEADVSIRRPYGLKIHPETGELLVCDAKSFVIPGTLHCFAADGSLRWSVTTGDIPAHIAFLTY